MTSWLRETSAPSRSPTPSSRGDDDPLNNTVTAHYHPDGFENDITDEDSHEVDLFQPGVDITKDGSAVSKVGDDVTYDYTIENTGSADSPNLIRIP